MVCLRVSDEAAQGQGSHLKAEERSLLPGFTPLSAVGSRGSSFVGFGQRLPSGPCHAGLSMRQHTSSGCAHHTGRYSKTAREVEVSMFAA